MSNVTFLGGGSFVTALGILLAKKENKVSIYDRDKNVVDDINILKCANHEAKLIVNNINEDNKKLCTEIMRGIERNSRYICFN